MAGRRRGSRAGFYTRRYEDLATEVTLLEKRLESGAGDPAATRTHAPALREQLPTAAVIGDLAALDARLDALLAAAEDGRRGAGRPRAGPGRGIAAKEALVAEAEKIAETATSWKVSGDRLRAIVDEWKLDQGHRPQDRRGAVEAVRRRPRRVRQAPRPALRPARRRARHRQAAKEKLVARAEELSDSSDWNETAAAMRDLMTEWKAAPRAGRDVEDALWARFRAAQDAFFARRSEISPSATPSRSTTRRRRKRSSRKAEALDLSDPKAAQTALRDLQAASTRSATCPRDAMRRIDDRMRAAEQRVRDAVDAEWRASVESNPFLAALRDRLAEAEAKLERAGSPATRRGSPRPRPRSNRGAR